MNSSSWNANMQDFYLSASRPWLFGGKVDGIWILLPIAIFGTIVNSFMLWILRTKVSLATSVNTMISMECAVRVFLCFFVYIYKAWIFTISPMLGLSMLPDPIHCYIGGLLSYLVGIATTMFNLLTNVLRYFYVRGSSMEDEKVKRVLRKPYFHIHLLIGGVIVTFIHGLSTYFVPPDQFFFDQACLRPHDDLKAQTSTTKMHNYSLATYNLISITFCVMLIMRIKSEEKRLNLTLNKTTVVQRKNKKNLYTAGTGIAHFVVIFVLLIVFNIPAIAVLKMNMKVTTSIQSFMMECIGFVTHGIVTPCIIFWASSEARKPLIEKVVWFKFYSQCLKNKLKDLVKKDA